MLASMGSSPSSLYRFIEGGRVGRFPMNGYKDACKGKALEVGAGTGQDRVAIALQIAVGYINSIFPGRR